MQTSILSYAALKPVLGEKQQAVYDVLCSFGPAHSREIRDHLRGKGVWMERNDVASRVNELHKMGLVVPGEKVYDAVTKKTVVQWMTKNRSKMEEM